MIIPYQVDVPLARTPYMNWLVLAATIAVFIVQLAVMDRQSEDEEPGQPDYYQTEPMAPEAFEPDSGQSDPREPYLPADPDGGPAAIPSSSPTEPEPAGPLDRFVLEGWNPVGLVGYMWLHGGILHLAGNMIFLWVFGNAVCAKVGNLRFLLIYIVLGVLAGAAHVFFVGDDVSVVGASGAINGIVGMYLVWYPINSISCVWFFFFPFGRTFHVDSYWMILFWLAFDIWGAFSDGIGVAYFAHLGGFAAGVGLAILLLKVKWVRMDELEKSLLEVLGWQIPQEDKVSAFVPASGSAGGAEAADDSGGWMAIQPVGAKPKPLAQRPPARPSSGSAARPESGPSAHPAGRSDLAFPALHEQSRSPSASGPSDQPPAAGDATRAGSSAQRPPRPQRPQTPQTPQTPPQSDRVVSYYIRFACPACGHQIKAPRKIAGGTGRCPRCKQTVQVPADDRPPSSSQ
ncbi:MAG: rhomboid family intramembrane serine protease [Sedimentisphaerales bacterium]|nr:rhomboid family intramembrane serine protease [Sedimentisphaerales bacterium]